MEAEHTDLAQQRLTRKAWRLADKVAAARDHGFSPRAYRRRVKDDPPATLARRVRDAAPRPHSARRAERRRASSPAASPTLEAIAACESGGNPGTDTGNGFYGKYPVHAADVGQRRRQRQPRSRLEAEQNRRAAALYAREGASPWPVCGR